MDETTDIGHVPLRDRPLVVCDIDEVVLEFLTPFTRFLRARDHDLLARSFRIHGNVVSNQDGTVPDDETVSAFLEDFFLTQDQWQTPAERVVETLTGLAGDADIVFLTAMPPRHQQTRRAVLDRFGLHFPMIATEQPKGPVLAQLHGDRPQPVVFLDDIERNLLSVGQAVPDCLLVNLMANADFRPFLPVPSPGIVSVEDWSAADMLIRAHIGL
ncbi:MULTISPECIES: hypothetical protein [Rhizobium]|uniref:HAD family hydrolase n=1 Tax=Rhizobium rhododendri TaxID=2506430 RepID=A0ABY8IL04_9HYPH|nr:MULTISPECIES: hypothetical protein [Rhizobium]MBO9098122.1 hypothetical protein [Rhizobium sp. L58/93]MBO9133096.1 hypothetical protein [Rhizobium sp. B209b/85]MBO9168272.1 hypothetical protein [Rhizobium sp. L245/93]MBO9184318.1 hypothetical protein [Rhizobium sp. E27B/91]MBZ5759995.1 hypothetical protein [Rhizobium sp. VS19-DR96]